MTAAFVPADDSEPNTTFENIRQKHEMMRGGSPTIAPNDGGETVATAAVPFRTSEQELDNLGFEKEAWIKVTERARHRRSWNRCLYLFFMLLILLNMVPSSASGENTVDPVNQPENFSAVLYDNTKGLPTSEANAIVQTSEGFIWIGSYGGLIRYDGNTFVRLDSTNGITSIKCLFVDAQDRLWIGTNDNGVAVLEQGELRKWGKLDGMKSAHTRAIMGDESGTIYVATTCGIAMIDPDGALRMMEDEAIADANMRDLRMGSDGIIYGLTNFGDLMKIRDGKLISFLSAEESPVQGVASMLPDPAEPGKLWFEGGDFGGADRHSAAEFRAADGIHRWQGMDMRLPRHRRADGRQHPGPGGPADEQLHRPRDAGLPGQPLVHLHAAGRDEGGTQSVFRPV